MAKIDSLVESVKKLEPFLTALTNPDLAYSELQSNMSKHIKDMNDIVTKNVENSRAQFELAISGDVAKMKAEISSEAVKLLNDLGTVNKQHYQDYGTASKKIFENQNATIEQYLRDEHTNVQNYTELKKRLELSKHDTRWWFSGLIVVLLLVNFFTVIYMKNNISATTSTNVINAIKQIRDAQIKTPTPSAVNNHKKS